MTERNTCNNGTGFVPVFSAKRLEAILEDRSSRPQIFDDAEQQGITIRLENNDNGTISRLSDSWFSGWEKVGENTFKPPTE